jgi:hypothetical protein
MPDRSFAISGVYKPFARSVVQAFSAVPRTKEIQNIGLFLAKLEICAIPLFARRIELQPAYNPASQEGDFFIPIGSNPLKSPDSEK